MSLVKLSPAGVYLMSNFGPHFRDLYPLYAAAAVVGGEVDWWKMRGQLVGESKRSGLAVVVWPKLCGGQTTLRNGFIEPCFEEPTEACSQ